MAASGLNRGRRPACAIKIGAKVVSHGRYVTFQVAEVAVSRQIFNFRGYPDADRRLRVPSALA
jgi:hypothetical protein